MFVVSDLVDTTDTIESHDLLVADQVLIIVFSGNEDGVEEIDIFGNEEIHGGNLPELLF